MGANSAEKLSLKSLSIFLLAFWDNFMVEFDATSCFLGLRVTFLVRGCGAGGDSASERRKREFGFLVLREVLVMFEYDCILYINLFDLNRFGHHDCPIKSILPYLSEMSKLYQSIVNHAKKDALRQPTLMIYGYSSRSFWMLSLLVFVYSCAWCSSGHSWPILQVSSFWYESHPVYPSNELTFRLSYSDLGEYSVDYRLRRFLPKSGDLMLSHPPSEQVLSGISANGES